MKCLIKSEISDESEYLCPYLMFFFVVSAARFKIIHFEPAYVRGKSKPVSEASFLLLRSDIMQNLYGFVISIKQKIEE